MPIKMGEGVGHAFPTYKEQPSRASTAKSVAAKDVKADSSNHRQS